MSLAAGGVIWTLLLILGDAPRAWRSLLINFLYFTPLAAGLVTWSAIVLVSKGRWADEAEGLAWSGFGFFVPSLVLLITLWIGSPQWAPWFDASTPPGKWLDNTFLFARNLLALAAFWSAAAWYLFKRRAGRPQSVLAASVLIVFYAVVFSLLGYDLGMALNPAWSSAIFGAYFFVSGLYHAVVFWALLAVAHPVIGPRSGNRMRSDFGRLIITFSILSAYFFYMQLLTIWFENLPRETSYLVNRMNHPAWNKVSLALIVVIYLAPVALLLTERAKHSRLWLGGVALLLLAGVWVQRWWMVMPDLDPDMQFGLVEAAATATVLGLAGIGMGLAGKRLSPLPPREVP